MILLAPLFLAMIGSGCGNTNTSTGNQTSLNLMGSKQGHSVGFVDFDGDGIMDKIVGAPYAVTTANQTGAIIVYKGTATGFNSAPSAALTGDDNLGYSFANLGDVDNDGKNDFAAGAIHGDGADVSLSGSVTLYKGGSSGQIIKKLSGEEPMDKFGFSMAAGDLNGDGSPDIVVGAPFNTHDPALYQAGAVYVFFGPDFTSAKALYATSSNKGLGWAVATGDINGDTRTDLLIVSNKVVSGITIYSVLGFYGVQGEPFSPLITAPDVTISGTSAGFGKALAVVGNIDGNPGGEIAIGAPNAVITLAGVSSRDVGSVSIVSTATGTIVDVAAGAPMGSLLARLDGESLFSRFGSSVTPVGMDVAVGAPMLDVDWNILSGGVYVFKGADIAANTPWAHSSIFSGMVKNQGYGTSIAFGNQALLIGAPRSNMNTGGVDMVDPATGQSVPGGSSGGSTGGSGACH